MLTTIFLIVILIWVVIITIAFLRLKTHYNNLITRTKKDKIDDILDFLISRNKSSEEEISNIKKELKQQINLSKLHFQKIGLVRFNPFERTGGEQSFVLAILDSSNNGLTLNFINTKEGLRVYTKRIKLGLGDEYELSVEEKKAIEKSH